ncbi:hypothetical protein GQX74_006286 [Glossina fuscipes]|nr:hypothetical protein GQX74_006286 [Glossina fuscipes]
MLAVFRYKSFVPSLLVIPLPDYADNAFSRHRRLRKNGKVGGDKKFYAMKVLKKGTLLQRRKGRQSAHDNRTSCTRKAAQQSPFLVGNKILNYCSDVKPNNLHEATVKISTAEVMLALQHRHRLGIIYQDIKLDVLLDGHQDHLILLDFEFPKIFTSEYDYRAYIFCGTAEYFAPEVLRSANWWSVGVLT